MKKSILLRFFTLLCVLQHCSTLGDLHNGENKVSSLQLVANKQQGKYSTDNVNAHGEDCGEYLKTKFHTIGMEKAQKGKGTYGGANVIHKRPDAKSAASVLLRSPFRFISTTNVCTALSLLILLLPHLIA